MTAVPLTTFIDFVHSNRASRISIVRNAKLPRQPRFSQHAPLIVDYDWLLSV